MTANKTLPPYTSALKALGSDRCSIVFGIFLIACMLVVTAWGCLYKFRAIPNKPFFHKRYYLHQTLVPNSASKALKADKKKLSLKTKYFISRKK